MRVVKIQHQCNILAGSGPDAYNEVSTNASYARENRDWFDDEDE